MQKLIEADFYCYPKNQSLCLYYSDASVLKTRLFKGLSLQVSPKEGFLLRLRKSNLGHYFSKLFRTQKVKLSLPENSNTKIIYRNDNNLVYFDFENSTIKKIHKKLNNNKFLSINFLGYSLIESYSAEEYFTKRDNIIKAIKARWSELVSGERLHGDFTHFNILLSTDGKIKFIDNKVIDNSILFDHFYFYGYYLQCLKKCKTINKKDVSIIKYDLQDIIFNTCKSSFKKEYLQSIKLDAAIGLTNNSREIFLNDFKQIFN